MTRLITVLGSLSLVFFLATGSLYASFSTTQKLRVDVPFDFYVGHQTFPAGEYRLVPAGGDGLYLIYSNDGKHSAYLDTIFVQTCNVSSKSRAVFKKNGRHNVFSEFSVFGGVRTLSAANAGSTAEFVQTAEGIAFERMEASLEHMKFVNETIAAEQAETADLLCCNLPRFALEFFSFR